MPSVRLDGLSLFAGVISGYLLWLLFSAVANIGGDGPGSTPPVPISTPTPTGTACPEGNCGTPQGTNPTPSSGNSIDIVFIPDEAYGPMSGSPDDLNFQKFATPVADLVVNGLWRSSALSGNQDHFLLWILPASGKVTNVGGVCPSVTWPDPRSTAFADVIVLVHPTTMGDCGSNGRLTIEPGSYAPLVHEVGHAAFGLPDEYRTGGGYWQKVPVLYSDGNNCKPVSGQGQCQQLQGSMGETWWRSEAGIPDVMVTTDGTPMPQFGPRDWEVISERLSRLRPLVPPATPSVFAPNTVP